MDLTEHDEDLREPLVRRQGSQVSMRVARGPTLNHFLSNKLENFCLGHFSISIALLSLFLVNTLALSAPGEHAQLCILVAGKDAVWGEDAP